MSLKVWIGREFETQHEREQIAEVIRVMRESFERSSGDINVLCNFEFGDAPVDFAVIKNDALVIVDLKTANGAVHGGANGNWTFVDEGGQTVVMNQGRGKNKNPFIQMRNYRHSAISFLQKQAGKFMNNRQLACCKCLDRFVKCAVLLYPNLNGARDKVSVEGTYKLWFSAQRPLGFCQFIQSQTSSFDFDAHSLKKLIGEVLNLREAHLIGNAPALPAEEGLVEETIDVPLHAETANDGTVEDKEPHGEELVSGFSNVPVSEPKIPNSRTLEDRPKIEPWEVNYIASGVRDAVNAKGLKGDVREVFYTESPDYDVEGNWGALCVFAYEDSGKDIQSAKKEIDCYLDEEDHKSYIIGNRIVWAFPSDVKFAGEPDSVLEKVPSKEPRGILTETIPTFASSRHEIDRNVVLPRNLDYLLYGVKCLPWSEDRGCDASDMDLMVGCNFPRAYAETYSIFDALFAHDWERRLEGRKDLVIVSYDVASGGSMIGFLFALRRWTSGTLERVKIGLLSECDVFIDVVRGIIETLIHSDTFAFKIDIVAGSCKNSDVVIFNGRRDGGSRPINLENELCSSLGNATGAGIILVSDASAGRAQAMRDAVDASMSRCGEEWVDATDIVNDSTEDRKSSLSELFNCQILSKGAVVSRQIDYRVLSRSI